MIHPKIPLGAGAARRIFWGQSSVLQQDFSPMPVRFDDVRTAFEFVAVTAAVKPYCAGGRAGSIGVLRLPMWTKSGDDLPEGAEDDPNYIAVPHKQVLGLGKALALDFAREFLPKDYDGVRDMFGRCGGYRNFRALVTKRRVLERWYDFESKATKRAVREWCELNEIEITD
jgi:hypothetical protein